MSRRRTTGRSVTQRVANLVQVDDGVIFDPAGVRAIAADHDEDGYDGVKVFVRATVGQTEVERLSLRSSPSSSTG